MRKLFLLVFLFSGWALTSTAQQVPSPREHFGFSIGDDYHLANYTQTEAYFKKLAAASNRVKLVDIGPTEEGRTQYMLVVSAPQNLQLLQNYKSISQQLARAGVNQEEAKQLSEKGKAIVWIDGGLHATETVSPHQLIETVYQVVSRNDAETMRILNDVIILFVHVNPDGQELVANWYMREQKPEKRSFNHLPRLYQKYIGHDNNRDFFMMNMKETRNISRQQYIEWMPQIIYNHHQEGPSGSVVAGPPYRDPFNFVYDPLLVTSIDAVGAAMNNRLNREGKEGFTQRSGSVFSTWWNGGLRTTPYFHNMIGLLTEIIGKPYPIQIPAVPARLIPNGGTPNPVTPRKWHFKNSIDYSVSMNYAVLDYAARHKEQLLYNIYQMGRNAIEAGSKDHWSLSPWKIDSMKNAYRKDLKGEIKTDTIPVKYYNLVMKDPSLRDPTGYIIPSDGKDFPTAVQFLNSLIRSGVQVLQADADFSIRGKKYPRGSYIVKTAQAFRPHVMDMFEPQDHPNDFQYPGGPPVRPYDAAGWTLAYQMGVSFDRILENFSGPFRPVPYGEVQVLKGTVPVAASAGFTIPASYNNAFLVVNDLIKGGVEVFRMAEVNSSRGNFYIPFSNKAQTLLQQATAHAGIEVGAVSKTPSRLQKVEPLRIALWDTYGGSMPSGWMRWILEQYRFPFTRIYAREINRGNLKNKYDVILFPGGAIPASGSRQTARGPRENETPETYRHTLGAIDADTSVRHLKAFLQAGGNIVTIGSSASLANHLGLPVQDALLEMADGKTRPLPREKYYIPGSILKASTDTAHPAAWGLPGEVNVYFNNSPVFTIAPDAMSKGTVKPLIWFSQDKPLKSGWAWGQGYLKNGVTAFTAAVGKGNLFVFGPEITFRAQSHGTYKFLFNQLYRLQP